MVSAKKRKRAWLLSLALLGGCYAEIEGSDVSLFQRQVCGNPPQCPGGNVPLSLAQQFIPPLPFDLGDSDLLTRSEWKEGGVTFSGSLIVNRTVITMTAPANGDFSAVRTVDLSAGGDSCRLDRANCRSLASYDIAVDGRAGRTLVLRGSGANLLEITGGSKVLTVRIAATGNAPAPATWQADTELNMALKARGSYP